MASEALNVDSSVTCPSSGTHGNGTVSATTSSARVRIDGAAVVRAGDTFTVSGCGYTDSSSGIPIPCLTVSWSGTSTRVRVDGQPLVVQESSGTCTPLMVGAEIQQTQSRVKAT